MISISTSLGSSFEDFLLPKLILLNSLCFFHNNSYEWHEFCCLAISRPEISYYFVISIYNSLCNCSKFFSLSCFAVIHVLPRNRRRWTRIRLNQINKSFPLLEKKWGFWTTSQTISQPGTESGRKASLSHNSTKSVVIILKQSLCFLYISIEMTYYGSKNSSPASGSTT